MDALALTDRHGLTGAVEFYEACQAAGIKPILGLEVKMNHRLGSGDLVLLAMDRAGWRSLCRISSRIQTDPTRDPERGLDFDDLAPESEGLICLTGGTNELIQAHLERGEISTCLDLLGDLHAIFPDRLYLDLVRSGYGAPAGGPGRAVRTAHRCCQPGLLSDARSGCTAAHAYCHPT